MKPTLTTISPIEDITRREFMSSALAAALLVACGSDEEEPSGQTTRTVTDAFGDPVEVPLHPQRVVATDFYSAGNLLSLGVPLVGTLGADGKLESSLTDFFKTEGITAIGGIGETIDFEAIVALNPDLIVEYVDPAERPDETTVRRLRAIAPYLMIEAFTGRLQPLAARTEAALGVDKSLLAALQSQYDAVIADIRNLLGADGWAKAIVGNGHFVDGGSIIVWAATNHNAVMEIVDAIGASRLNKTDERLVLSAEQVRDIDCDVLIRTGLPVGSLPQTYETLQVVQAKQVISDLPDYWSGLHYPARIEFAKFFLGKLRAMTPIRTDIV